MSLIVTMFKTKCSNNITRKNVEKIQNRKLKKLVSYARKNSTFYANKFKHIESDYKLSDLPVTTKPEMMNSFDSVLTDSSINMKRIDDFTSDLDNIGRMIDNKYLIFKTSGSTGNPAVVLYDKQNIEVSSAIAAFRTFARNEDYKSFMKHGKKTAGVFADYGFYLACGMSRYLQLKMPGRKTKITVDVNGPEKEIIDILNEFKPSMLSGYPSNLALLADFDELNISPDIVITGGELLTDEIREKLTKKFGCYVQTHYSCTEGGEIACECSAGHLHINEDWVILEPVDKDNRPVDFGELSDKVLLTNLSNYIQPFIRYEITDRVIVHNEKCSCGKKSHWIEIEGRTDDIFEFENEIKIAPMSFYKILEEIKSIKRFQMIQKSHKELELRLVSDDKETAFTLAQKALESFLNSKGIKDVNIILSDSEPQANKISGKFKHFCKDIAQNVCKEKILDTPKNK